MNDFANIIGQKHLVSKTGILNKMIENNNFHSFVLSGNSGIGKTTLAKTFIKLSMKTSYDLNATKTSKKEFQEILNTTTQETIIILIDEIHRLDRPKQDMLLPFLEQENIIVIGTTTENTIFALSDALRSRLFVFPLKEINTMDMKQFLIKKNLTDYPQNILEENVIDTLIQNSNGDLRKVIQYFNFIVKNYNSNELNEEVLSSLINSNIQYQKNGDEHYDYISAFQKSIRASDVQASVYYLGKLLTSGDYKIILRRIIIIAYEDVGLANPEVVYSATSVIDAFERVGMPEGRIILSNYVIELALSPKSKLAYESINNVLKDIEKRPGINVFEHIKQNQKTYDPLKSFYTNNLPKEIRKTKFVNINPNTNNEKKLLKRLNYLEELKKGGKGYE